MRVREITRAEFDRLAVERVPLADLLYEEKRWFVADDGAALAVVLFQKIGSAWQWLVLKKDGASYRVAEQHDVASEELAIHAARDSLLRDGRSD